MKSLAATLTKIIFLVLLLSLGYYLFFLKPKIELAKKLTGAQNLIASHESLLVENRIAFIELTKIKPDSNNKSQILAKIRETNQESLKALAKPEKIPDIDQKLTNDFPGLLARNKDILERQQALLDELTTKRTYAEGIALLKSDKSIKLLTEQTNLILQYQFWLSQIKEKQLGGLP